MKTFAKSFCVSFVVAFSIALALVARVPARASSFTSAGGSGGGGSGGVAARLQAGLTADWTSIPVGLATKIPFNSTVSSTGSGLSFDTTLNRCTVSTAGTVEITLSLQWTPPTSFSATQDYWYVQVAKNGTRDRVFTLRDVTAVNTGAGYNVFLAQFPYPVAANDYLEFFISIAGSSASASLKASYTIADFALYTGAGSGGGFSGGVLTSALSWATGGGYTSTVAELQGPTDAPMTMKAGTGQAIDLTASGQPINVTATALIGGAELGSTSNPWLDLYNKNNIYFGTSQQLNIGTSNGTDGKPRLDVHDNVNNTGATLSIKTATGAGTATFASTTCPATTLTAPYTWLKFYSSDDGSIVYVPAWK